MFIKCTLYDLGVGELEIHPRPIFNRYYFSIICIKYYIGTSEFIVKIYNNFLQNNILFKNMVEKK